MKTLIEDIYPLTSMQQGMLFHSVSAPRSGIYIEQLSGDIEGPTDVVALRKAWEQVVNRHSVLRSGFIWERPSEPVQVVYRHVSLPWEEHDWRGLVEYERAEQLDSFLEADRRRGFDLTEAPLMRITLFRVARDAYYIVWTHHHILMDGWSISLIQKEILALYEAFREGGEPRLQSSPPFRDYLGWLQKQNQADAESFWRKKLLGYSGPTSLPLPQPLRSPTTKDDAYGIQRIQLDSRTTTALKELAQRNRLTLSTLVHGAWAVLLSRYIGVQDIVFGSLSSGRPADLLGSETMVGLFINTLPARVRVPPQSRLLSWLQELQAQQVELRQYEYSSLVDIHGWSNVPRGTSLFESILIYESYPIDSSFRGPRGTRLRIRNVRAFSRTNYPVTAVVSPSEELRLLGGYDRSRIDDAAMVRMLGHWRSLLEGMATSLDKRIEDLPLLPALEAKQVLVDWNMTRTAYPDDVCIHQLFESQVERTPEALAVILGNNAVTYCELNVRVSKLANHLRALGVESETRVGLYVHRSIEMIVGLLAILKAGAAYVPLDPTTPPRRVALMLEKVQAKILLTQQRLVDNLLTCDARIICLDGNPAPIADVSTNTHSPRTTVGQLAYIIYTSGSMGTPKGVMIDHRALVNRTLCLASRFGMTRGQRLLQFVSLGFDASAEEIFPTLVSGATLVLHSDPTQLQPHALLLLCEHYKVNVLHLPIKYWQYLLDEMSAGGRRLPECVRLLVAGGESSSIQHLIQWGRLVPHRSRFINAYGPSEATITATVYDVALESMALAGLTLIPIGRPLANTEIYLLDANLKPLPVGIPGECYIGGDSLARGYVDDPALTAERFIPHPFSRESGTRLYRTGDLARYRGDGEIEFLGRLDRQVKIRGFRVELDEIERVLISHPSVRDAAVVNHETPNGDKRLIAYLISTGVAMDDLLLNFLRERLPYYMIPTVFLKVDEFPVTLNGKIDRNALMRLPVATTQTKAPLAAPRNWIEEGLTGIWSDTLECEQVGIYENFLDLGGHSLIAMRIISRISSLFQVDLSFADLFAAPTVASLAERIEAKLGIKPADAESPVRPVARTQTLPLSVAQEQLWRVNKVIPDTGFFNMTFAAHLTGVLNIPALRSSLNEIVRRHETLRTHFVNGDKQPIQIIASKTEAAFAIVDLKGLPLALRDPEARRQARGEARRAFDLSVGPLLRVTLWRLATQEQILLVVMHHIVSDGWSMGLFLRELATLYDVFSKSQPSPLPGLEIQYADFAFWQRQWLLGHACERQLAYWKHQLRGILRPLQLATDFSRPPRVTLRTSARTLALGKSLSEEIRRISRKRGATVFMTLLAGLKTLLYFYTGEKDVRVGTLTANRQRGKTEGLVGLFLNTLVLRTDLAGNPTFNELLSRVREVALGAYAHQDLPFEYLLRTLETEEALNRSALFQVMFVLENAAVASIELPGVSSRSITVGTGPDEPKVTITTSDLILVMEEGSDGLVANLKYKTELFFVETIDGILADFRNLLERVVLQPDQRLSACYPRLL